MSACGGSDSTSQIESEQPSPITVTLQQVFSGLDFEQLLGLVQIPGDDSKWYAVERTGRIWEFDNNDSVTQRRLFLDLSNVVNADAQEAGLLGFAFHPNYLTNGEAFVSFVRGSSELTSTLSRFRTLNNGQTLDVSTEEVILTIAQPFANHNGGHVVFGLDGLLYMSFGDGGSANDPLNNAQDKTNLHGSIIRIDVDNGTPYQIPSTNPFSMNALCTQGVGVVACPEIFAYGLRNTWRFNFDISDARIWGADVGQSLYEEVNIIEQGNNYGWRIREGARCNAVVNSQCDLMGLVDPVWEYGRSLGRSVTGGYVYRGENIASLQATYVFGDFVSGMIWGFPIEATQDAFPLIDSNVLISSFAQANNGELFVLDLGGDIFQIVAEN